MQNQLQYPQSFPTQNANSNFSHQKMGSPTHFKMQDRTLPSQNLKHYSSNPNLSLDINAMKSSQFTSDSNAHSQNTLKKNLEYRSPPSHTHHGLH